MKYLFSTALLLCISVLGVSARVVMPAIFSDNMVLQQKRDARVWGKAAPGKTVTITPSWDGKEYKVKALADGSWSTSIPTPAASYAVYDITISDGEPLKLSNVQIGEVWFCSGQSNMEMYLNGRYGQTINGGLNAALNSTNPNLRLFTVKRNSIIEPQYDCEGRWEESCPEVSCSFSATAYFFGEQLQRTLGVPVGLIHSSWGGSSIEAWMPADILAAFPEKIIPKNASEIDPNKPHTTPTLLYNGMLKPVLGYSIAGCIWYQGETNQKEPALYERMFAAMVKNWRDTWGSGDFGFYFVQIAPFEYGPGNNSAFMREAQLNCSKNVPNTGMAVLLDIGERNDIHPKEKKLVGQRLACSALSQTYGVKGIPFSGPVYKSMEVAGDKITIEFDYADELTVTAKPVEGFEIAGEDRIFYPATTSMGWNNKITLASDKVAKPVAVRYCFKDYAKGTLYNRQGLPASSFRTDNWDK